ncbi:unnamed protein product, partial [Allacma fusca]
DRSASLVRHNPSHYLLRIVGVVSTSKWLLKRYDTVDGLTTEVNCGKSISEMINPLWKHLLRVTTTLTDVNEANSHSESVQEQTTAIKVAPICDRDTIGWSELIDGTS